MSFYLKILCVTFSTLTVITSEPNTEDFSKNFDDDLDIEKLLIQQFKNDSSTTIQRKLQKHMDLWMESSQRIFAQSGNNIAGVENFHCPEFADENELSIDYKNRNSESAKSVHAMRPADIRVVAAMGDSLTAGMGAGAQSMADDHLEYRGLAFPIGGDGDLQFMATLPNILKRFNPNLTGASHRVGPVWYRFLSQLNVAISGSTADDLYRQAVNLVNRIVDSPEIDQNMDWKLVTIFIGSNDMCKYCTDQQKYSASNYTKNVKRAVDYLKANLPRTLVNLVSLCDAQKLKRLNKDSPMCEALHKLECPCLSEVTESSFEQLLNDYRNGLARLANSIDYLQGDTFAVIFSPAIQRWSAPVSSNGKAMLGYMAPDCFHFSQITHSLAARLIWNNLLEPFGDKTSFDITDTLHKFPLKCPNRMCPFIRTGPNTLDCDFFLNQNKSRADRVDFLRRFIGKPKSMVKFAYELTNNPRISRNLTKIGQKTRKRLKKFQPEKYFLDEERITDEGFSTFSTTLVLAVTGAILLSVISMGILALTVKFRQKRRRVENERTPLLATPLIDTKYMDRDKMF